MFLIIGYLDDFYKLHFFGVDSADSNMLKDQNLLIINYFSRRAVVYSLPKPETENRRSVRLQVLSGFTSPKGYLSLHHLREGKADLTQISIISSTLNSSFCRWETHSRLLWEFLSPFRESLSQYRQIHTLIYILDQATVVSSMG